MSMLMGNRRPAIPPPSPPASFSPLGTIGAELAENFELMKVLEPPWNQHAARSTHVDVFERLATRKLLQNAVFCVGHTLRSSFL